MRLTNIYGDGLSDLADLTNYQSYVLYYVGFADFCDGYQAPLQGVVHVISSKSMEDNNQPINVNVKNSANKIYPNPLSQNLLNISLDDYNSYEIKVYDVNHKEILHANSYSNKHQINLSHIKPGIYVIKLIVSDGIIVKKLIKK